MYSILECKVDLSLYFRLIIGRSTGVDGQSKGLYLLINDHDVNGVNYMILIFRWLKDSDFLLFYSCCSLSS